MLDKKSVKEFVEELSSNSPAPGGGSVAALCGSLSSALSSMVFNLTIGKKIFNEYDEETKKVIEKSLKEANEIKDEFLNLMNEDTESFLSLMKAFKLPKSTEEEKKVRKEKIQEGYKKALEVPLKVAEKSYEIYDNIEIAYKYGNKNAISDAGVAALLAQSALEGAILNVEINLSSIKDEEYKEKIKKHCEELKTNGLNKKNKILQEVNKEINK